MQVSDHTPRSITIYGAGGIGCEYASIYGNLGFKVDLVNTRERLLEFLDDEITDALGYHLRNQGVVIRHLNNGVIVHCQSGKRLKNDWLLWANGRSGNTANMAARRRGGGD